ncbi:hypothetical protein CGRA01v4_14814 [Colletotrichum graminicola]|nr:hypothetical protein CGRA01v4_14814 [Colletotrichum graminicola]
MLRINGPIEPETQLLGTGLAGTPFVSQYSVRIPILDSMLSLPLLTSATALASRRASKHITYTSCRHCTVSVNHHAFIPSWLTPVQQQPPAPLPSHTPLPHATLSPVETSFVTAHHRPISQTRVPLFSLPSPSPLSCNLPGSRPTAIQNTA